MAETGNRLVYRVHAVERMQQRGISDAEVRTVLLEGKEIERYPRGLPYPSRLMHGWIGARPIHVVVADNSADNEAIVVTVYEADPNEWEPGFERRKA